MHPAYYDDVVDDDNDKRITRRIPTPPRPCICFSPPTVCVWGWHPTTFALCLGSLTVIARPGQSACVCVCGSKRGTIKIVVMVVPLAQ